MAVICPSACVVVSPTSLPQIGCKPLLRDFGFKRLVFFACDIDYSTIIPVGGTPTGANIITAIETLWAAGVGGSATVFVSPHGLVTDNTEGDPTEVKLSDCGLYTTLSGDYTITMQFKYGWDSAAAAPTAPLLKDYGEEVFFKHLKNNPASWNYGFINCAGELGYFMTKDEDEFASGSVSVKLLSEDLNDCKKIPVYEVKLTFKCGAVPKRIVDLTNPSYDELIAWL